MGISVQEINTGSKGCVRRSRRALSGQPHLPLCVTTPRSEDSTGQRRIQPSFSSLRAHLAVAERKLRTNAHGRAGRAPAHGPNAQCQRPRANRERSTHPRRPSSRQTTPLWRRALRTCVRYVDIPYPPGSVPAHRGGMQILPCGAATSPLTAHLRSHAQCGGCASPLAAHLVQWSL